ncbi:AaceriAFR323Wp [[Ashbya] aceris (nom. inval.)]|nr:AaceriAFR323Wp [[Ashbya] aceris (nom. inval.)]
MELQLDRAFSRFSSRDVHRYKSYVKQYLEWCRETGLDVDSCSATELWGSARRLHWFLQSKWGSDIESVAEMKSVVNCIQLLARELGTGAQLDKAYIDNVVRLYECTSVLHENGALRGQFEKICVNVWNVRTPSLKEKYFKTCLDKVKWLLDYQLNYYTNAALDERKTWVLKDFEVAEETVLVVRRRWAVLPQQNPLFCPLFTLAVYLHLRFYGVKKQYRGDGFPDLARPELWEELPIIRGKSLTKFPRVETLGNYYPAVFQYCQLPYKKRLYFQGRLEEPVFPATHEDASELDAHYFVRGVGRDFILGMNRYSLQDEFLPIDIPEDPVLYELFPDVERFETEQSARPFVQMMILLRKVMFRSLPVLYSCFPEHDLFQDPIFKKPQFIAYLNAADSLRDVSVPLHLLVEPTAAAHVTPPAVPAAIQASAASVPNGSVAPVQQAANPPDADLRKDTLQFVKDQTLANFTILIQLLSKLFEKVETRKSNKLVIRSELDALHSTLKRKISSLDVLPSAAHADEQPSKRRKSSSPHDLSNMSDLDDQSADADADADDADDVEELQQLVQQLVQRQVTQASQYILDKVRSDIRDIIREELASLSRAYPSPAADPKPAPADPPSHKATPTFRLQPDLASIEDIILEWFTPNPAFDGECVHSMNKKHGKTWRINSGQESIYKSRKVIVEFYIHLVNDLGIDRHEAVDHCERLKASQTPLEFSQWLKTYKQTHGNCFPDIT